MFYAVDVETSGIERSDELLLVSVANIFSLEERVLDPLNDLENVIKFFEQKPTCFFFNAPFDLFFLAKKLPSELLPERYFDLQSFVRKILPQPVTLKELAFALLEENDFNEYQQLFANFSTYNFAERPLDPNAEKYARYDARVTKLLALQFAPYWFRVLDDERLFNDFDRLSEYASVNFQEILRAFFKNELAGRLFLDAFARERLLSLSPEASEIERPDFRLKKTTVTTRKYSSKALLSTNVGVDLLKRVDVLLPKNELLKHALPEEMSALENAEVTASTYTRSTIQFTVPQCRLVSTNPETHLTQRLDEFRGDVVDNKKTHHPIGFR